MLGANPGGSELLVGLLPPWLFVFLLKKLSVAPTHGAGCQKDPGPLWGLVLAGETL